MSHPLPPKKEVALALLERSLVDIRLDPRVEGVVVPPTFRKQPQLVLKIGLNLPVPIPDLRLDDEGMTCTLSFSRTPYYCVVPWRSVFAMLGEDGRGMVWPDDIPPEIAQASGRPAEEPRPAPKARPAAAKRVPSALAETPSDEKPKGKRPSRAKKPQVVAVESEAERPVLVALPPVAERRGPRPVPAEKARPQPRPNAAPQPVPAPASPVSSSSTGGVAGPQTGQTKVKRELPPYLRVVK
ncbi:MAG TPA: ClpXP protease specificity-enhancing factor SspB [Polyangiaceae bacterium]|jgi:stringent starvation protein B